MAVTVNNTPVISNDRVLSVSEFAGIISFDGVTSYNRVKLTDWTIDCASGNYFVKSVDETGIFSFSNVPEVDSFQCNLEIVHISGGVGWPANVIWSEGEAPTLAPKFTHVISLSKTKFSDIWIASVKAKYDSGYLIDTVPDAYAFTDVQGAELNATVTSNTITVTGLEPDRLVIVKGANCTVDAGADVLSGLFVQTKAVLTSATGTIRVAAQTTSSSLQLDTQIATISVGSGDTIWRVATRSADITPSEITFVDINDAALNEWVVSDVITVFGLEPNYTFNISSVGGFVAAGTLTPSDTFSDSASVTSSATGTLAIQCQILASRFELDTTTMSVVVGDQQAEWHVTTRVAKFAPTMTDFASVNQAPLNTNIKSNVVTISGLEPNYPYTLYATEGFLDAGATTLTGIFSTAKTVLSSETGTVVVRLETKTSPYQLTTTTSKLLLNDVAINWNVTTKALQHTLITSGGLVDLIAVERSTEFTSKVITCTSLEPNYRYLLSCTNGTIDVGTSKLSGAYDTQKYVTTSGQGTFNLSVRTISSDKFEDTTTVRVKLDDSELLWKLTTRKVKDVPTPFTFESINNAEFDTAYPTVEYTVSGLEPFYTFTVSAVGGTVSTGTNSTDDAFNSFQRVQTSSDGMFRFVLMQKSGVSDNESTSATVTINQYSATRTITTRKRVLAPVVGSTKIPYFPHAVNPLCTVTSDQFCMTGLEKNYQYSITATGGLVSAGGGGQQLSAFKPYVVATSSSEGEICANVQLTTDSTFGSFNKMVICIGGTVLDWCVANRAAVVSPPDVSNVVIEPTEPSAPISPGDLIESAPIVLDGLEPNTPIEVCGTSGKIKSTSGEFVDCATLKSDDKGEITIIAQQPAPEDFNSTKEMIISVGDKQIPWPVTTRPPVTKPDDFSFGTPIVNAEPNTPVTSTPIKVKGLEPNQPVTIKADNGGKIDAGGDGLTGNFEPTKTVTASPDGTVDLAVQQTTSDCGGVPASTNVTVGDSDPVPFVAATRPVKTTPDDFEIPPALDAKFCEPVSSEPTTVTGLEPGREVPISATGGQVDAGTSGLSGKFAKAKVVKASPEGTITIAAKTTMSCCCCGAQTVKVKVGDKEVDWLAVPKVRDTMPDLTSTKFPDPIAEGGGAIPPGTPVTSDPIVVTGLEPNFPVPVSAVGGLIDGGTLSPSGNFDPVKIITTSPDGTLTLVAKQTTGNDPTLPSTMSVTIGGTTIPWTIPGRGPDLVPDSLDVFAPVTGADINSTITSGVGHITGLEPNTPIELTSTGGEISTGGPFSTNLTTTSSPEGTLDLTGRITTGNTFDGPHTLDVSLGGSKIKWTVTTRTPDVTPSESQIPTSSGAEPGSLATSDIFTITGLEPNYPFFITSSGGTFNAGSNSVGGAFVDQTIVNSSGAGSIVIQAQQYTPNDFAADKTMNVRVGNTDIPWTVTTRDARRAPDPVNLTNSSADPINPGTTIQSDPVTITGLEPSREYTFSADPGQLNNGTPDGSYTSSITGTTTPDGTFDIAVRQPAPNTFGTPVVTTVYVDDVPAGTWTNTTRDADLTPDSFYIPDARDANPNGTVISEIVPVTGLEPNCPIPVSITGGSIEAAIDLSVAYASLQTALTATSSATGSIQIRATTVAVPTFEGILSPKPVVTVGNKSAEWLVVTRSPDLTPNAFNLSTGQIINPNDTIISDVTPITGLEPNYPVTITGTGGKISASTGQPSDNFEQTQTVTADNQGNLNVKAQLLTGPAYDASSEMGVTVGNLTSIWKVTSRVPDLTPEPFVFADIPTGINGAQLSAETLSNQITVEGLEPNYPFTVVATNGSIDGGADNLSGNFDGVKTLTTSPAGTLQLQAKLLSHSGFEQTKSMTVAIGNGSTTWNVGTRSPKTTPDPFNFVDVRVNGDGSGGAERAVATTSNTVRVTGLEPNYPITVKATKLVTAGLDPVYSSTKVVTTSDSGTLDLTALSTASTNFLDIVTNDITIGNYTTTWSVQTRAPKVDATPFSFPDVVNAEFGVEYASEPRPVTGLEANYDITVDAIDGTVSAGATPSSTFANSVTARTDNFGSLWVTAKGTSSSTELTPTRTTVKIGKTQSTFTINTRVADKTPATFSFNPSVGVGINHLVESEPTEVKDVEPNYPLPVQSMDGSMIRGGASLPLTSAYLPATTVQTSTSGNLYVQVQQQSSKAELTKVTSTVKVGDTQATWDTTTRAANLTPDDFSFVNTIGAEFGIPYIAETTVTGLEPNYPIEVNAVGGLVDGASSSAEYTTPDFQPTKTIMSSGDGSIFVKVSVTASASPVDSTSATVTVGTKPADYTVTTRAYDITPDANTTIPPVTGVEREATVLSDVVTIMGLEPNLEFNVVASGGTLDGGTSSLSGSYSQSKLITTDSGGNMTVQLRQQASSIFDTTGTMNISVGDTHIPWSATTRSPDLEPNPFNFPNKLENTKFGQPIKSDPVLISGLEPNYPINIKAINGQIYVNQDLTPYTDVVTDADSSGSVTLTAEQLASSDFGVSKTMDIKVNDTPGTWNLLTRPADVDPNPFTIPAVTDVELHTDTPSETITVSGLEPNYTLNIVAENGVVDVGTTAISGTFAPSAPVTTDNDGTFKLAVSQQSSAIPATTTTAKVHVGNYSQDWNVKTREPNLVPNPVTITSAGLPDPGVKFNSSDVVVTGLEPNYPVQISAVGGLVSAGTTSLSGVFEPTQTVTTDGDGNLHMMVQVDSSSVHGTANTVAVTVGNGTPVNWTVNTRDLYNSPASFGIPPKLGVEIDSDIQSDIIEVTGLEPNWDFNVTTSVGKIDGGSTSTSGLPVTGSKTIRTTPEGKLVFQATQHSSPVWTTSTKTTVAVGDKSAVWDIVTRDVWNSPVNLDFPFVYGAERNTDYYSTAVVSGLEPNFGFVISTTGATLDASVGGFTGAYSNSKTITTTDTGTVNVRLKMKSSTEFDTVTEGQILFDTTNVAYSAPTTVLWQIRTRLPDTAPDSFSIAPNASVGFNTSTLGASTTITGLEPNYPVSVSIGNGGTVDVGSTSLSGNYQQQSTVNASDAGSIVIRPNVMSSKYGSTTTSVPISVNGAEVTQWNVTTKAADTTPTTYTFTNLIDQPRNTTIQSNTVTVSGLEANYPITVSATNGQIKAATGGTALPPTFVDTQEVLTSGAGTLLVQAQTTTSEFGSISADTNVQVGVGSSTWTVATKAADITPNTFTIPTTTGAPLNQLVTSQQVSVSGLEPDYRVTISVLNGAGVIDGGTTALSGVYEPTKLVRTTSAGELVFACQANSSTTFDTDATIPVKIGSTQTTWTIHTRVPDTIPDAFPITTADGSVVNPVAATYSNVVIVSGLEPGYNIPVTATGGTIVAGTTTVDTAYAAAKNVVVGADGTIVLKAQQTSATYNAAKSMTVNVGNATYGSKTETWSITTRPPVTTPADFAFTNVTDAQIATATLSEDLVIQGLEPGYTPISVTSSGGTIAVGTSAIAATPTYSAAQTTTASTSGTIVVRAKLQSSPQELTSTSMTITVGGKPTTWSITTRKADITPAPFVLSSTTTPINLSTPITTSTITVDGLQPNWPVVVSTTGGNSTIDSGTTALSGAHATTKTVTTSALGKLVLAAKQTSSSDFNTPTTANVTVGDFTYPWTITTRPPVTNSTAFTLTALTGQELNADVVSGVVTVSGLEPNYQPIVVTATNGTVDAVIGTATTMSGSFSSRVEVQASPTGTIKIQAKQRTSSVGSTPVATTVAVGTTTSNWVTTTKVADITPNTFTITTNTSPIDPVTPIDSNLVTVTGLQPNYLVPISVTSGTGTFVAGSTQADLAGQQYVSSGNVMTDNNGAFVMLCRQLSATYNTVASSAFKVGALSATWNATTRAGDTTPDSYSFADVLGEFKFATTFYQTVVISGLEKNFPIPISVVGGSFEAVPSNTALTGTYGTAAKSVTTDSNGSLKVSLGLKSAATANIKTTATITVGTLPASWSITTRDVDVVPTLAFPTTVGGEEINKLISSPVLQVTDLEPNHQFTLTATGGTVGASTYGSPAAFGTSTQVTTDDFGSFYIQAKQQSAALANQQTSETIVFSAADTTLTSTAKWVITTMPADATPDAISFTTSSPYVTNGMAEPGKQIYSDPLVINGLQPNYTFSVSCTNGTFDIVPGSSNLTGTYSATTRNVTTDSSGSLKMVALVTASSTFGASNTFTFSIAGTVVANWVFNTRAKKNSPSGLSFTNQTNVPIATVITSDIASITGLEPNYSFTLTATGGTVNATVPGTAMSSTYAATKTVTTNSSGELDVALRSTSNQYQLSSVVTNVSLGDASTSWMTTTTTADLTPDPVSFVLADKLNNNPNAIVTATATLTGLQKNHPISASVNVGGVYDATTFIAASPNATLGTYSSSIGSVMTSGTGTLYIGVKTTADANFEAWKTVNVNVGNSATTWRVSTRAADITPAIAFTATTGVEPGLPASSAVTTISGLEPGYPFTVSATNGTVNVVPGNQTPSTADSYFNSYFQGITTPAAGMTGAGTLKIIARTTANPAEKIATPKLVTVTVGTSSTIGGQGTWSVTARNAVETATFSPATLTALTGVEPNAEQVSGFYAVTEKNYSTKITAVNSTTNAADPDYLVAAIPGNQPIPANPNYFQSGNVISDSTGKIVVGVKLTSGTYGATRTIKISVGASTIPWSVTTRALKSKPTWDSPFPAAPAAPPSTDVLMNGWAVVSNLEPNYAVSIAVSGGTFDACPDEQNLSGNFGGTRSITTGSSGRLKIRLRTTSSAITTGTGSVTVSVTVGTGTAVGWVVKTADTTPTWGTVTNQATAQPNQTYYSPMVTVSGLEPNYWVPVYLSDPDNPSNSPGSSGIFYDFTTTANGTDMTTYNDQVQISYQDIQVNSAGNIYFRFGAYANSTFGGTKRVQLNVSGVSKIWTLTTRVADFTPTANPAFTSVTGASPNAVVVSNIVEITGIEPNYTAFVRLSPATASVGYYDASGTMSDLYNATPRNINNATYEYPVTTSFEGKLSVVVAAYASPNYSTAKSLTLEVLDSNRAIKISKPWSVTTEAAPAPLPPPSSATNQTYTIYMTNVNNAADDDLQLIVNGTPSVIFPGNPNNPSINYKITKSSSAAETYKLELVIINNNHNGTKKELIVRNDVTKSNLVYATVTTNNSSVWGAVVWSKTITV